MRPEHHPRVTPVGTSAHRRLLTRIRHALRAVVTRLVTLSKSRWVGS